MKLNTVVGGYKVVETVGEGNMGTVFRGLDILLEREVALNRLRPELARNPEFVKRFRTESAALARLNHPHVVSLHQLLQDGENYFMVLEFVEGETLERLIRRCGPIPWRTALSLVCQALDGLGHAHFLKVIHRDIKPANLILAKSGVVKLKDFGIARILENTGMLQSGYVPGTLKYLSPEQIQEQHVDYRVDIYAMGMVLYELLTAHAPFQKRTDYELIRAHVEETPKPPRALVPEIPLRLEKAVLRALEKSPEDRFQSAAEFRGELEAILKATSAEQKIGDDNECSPNLVQLPSTTFGDTATIQSINGRLKAGVRFRQKDAVESSVQTAILPSRGRYNDSQQEAAQVVPAERFWTMKLRTAVLTLLIPVCCLAFYLAPSSLLSPTENTETPTPAIVESSVMVPYAERIYQARTESPSDIDAPKVSIGASIQSAETTPENFESQKEGEADEDVGQATPPLAPMTAQLMNSGDTANAGEPAKTMMHKRSSKLVSHYASSHHKKVDGGWTIISD